MDKKTEYIKNIGINTPTILLRKCLYNDEIVDKKHSIRFEILDNPKDL